nr:uncharacterized protein LOC115496356 isoform X2 [Taeniopygia guttata]
MKGKGEKEKGGGGRKGLKFPDEKCLPPSPRRAVPTNWKREESKGCPAAASARPTPGRRSQPARTAATPAGPERRPRCGTRCGSPERLGRGSAAHRPLSLCLHPNQRVAHRHAGSTRFLLALKISFMSPLHLKEVVSISRTSDLRSSRRLPQGDSGSRRAGHSACLLALERPRSFPRWDFRVGRKTRIVTKFCQQEHFLKCLFMLRISSASSTILFLKRNILYCDPFVSNFVSNYSKIE